MLLTIDCGNTNIVFALHRGETQLASWRTVSDSRKTVDELVSWLYPLMQLEGYQPSDVTGAILASVVPAARRALEGLCQKLFGLLPLVVGTEAVRLGVPVRVDRPEQVGADRLVNAVAAYARFGGDLVVIDFGTATTFDVIARDGAYEGGVIAPGINLSMEALHNASALLPRITVQQPERVIGKATIPAMESGVFWGYIGMIEGMISRIQAEYGAEMTVIATGGLAPLFERATEVIDHLDSDLTLRGLRMIYELNVNKRNIDGRTRGK
ncbi:type III pantothenate kinase [Kiloniella sp. b19]|uniref:type III pantothenate kinase n=1 Tax=Kiloniella sp. GXU_MW_B19 TaxID=3141326 RepID=UPI0031CE9579